MLDLTRLAERNVYVANQLDVALRGILPTTALGDVGTDRVGGIFELGCKSLISRRKPPGVHNKLAKKRACLAIDAQLAKVLHALNLPRTWNSPHRNVARRSVNPQPTSGSSLSDKPTSCRLHLPTSRPADKLPFTVPANTLSPRWQSRAVNYRARYSLTSR